jgi:hypothetical protein
MQVFHLEEISENITTGTHLYHSARLTAGMTEAELNMTGRAISIFLII